MGEKIGTDPLLSAGMGFVEVFGIGLFDEPGNGFFVLSGTGLGLNSVGVGSGVVGLAVGVGVGVGVGEATST